jgi:lysyl-tRNA synthetase class II
MRLHHVHQMKQAGETVYPHKYHVSISLRDFIDKYSHLKDEEVNDDIVCVAGRVYFNLITRIFPILIRSYLFQTFLGYKTLFL